MIQSFKNLAYRPWELKVGDICENKDVKVEITDKSIVQLKYMDLALVECNEYRRTWFSRWRKEENKFKLKKTYVVGGVVYTDILGKKWFLRLSNGINLTSFDGIEFETPENVKVSRIVLLKEFDSFYHNNTQEQK